jgi:hypothetical protein
MKGDVRGAEFAAMQFGGVVVADATDVVRPESPALAGNHGGSHLAAEHDARAKGFDLRAERRELGDLQNGVGGVFADAEDIEFGGAHGVVVAG